MELQESKRIYTFILATASLIKKFPAIYGVGKLITSFQTARHLALPRDR
jgi:hypothetical protein